MGHDPTNLDLGKVAFYQLNYYLKFLDIFDPRAGYDPATTSLPMMYSSKLNYLGVKYSIF